MIPLARSDIGACDHCGQCCKTSPCLLGSPAELFALSDRLGYDVRRHVVVERTPDEQWRVRISRVGKPCVLWDNGCTVHDIKPKGGREFECWTPATFAKTYHWSKQQLAEILP
jgi:Fe-S-cluster containining protein